MKKPKIGQIKNKLAYTTGYTTVFYCFGRTCTHFIDIIGNSGKQNFGSHGYYCSRKNGRCEMFPEEMSLKSNPFIFTLLQFVIASSFAWRTFLSNHREHCLFLKIYIKVGFVINLFKINMKYRSFLPFF